MQVYTPPGRPAKLAFRMHHGYAQVMQQEPSHVPDGPDDDPHLDRRRGRCALDKCYAYSSGARRRESVTEQQAQAGHSRTAGLTRSTSKYKW